MGAATYDEIRALLTGTDEVGQPGDPIDMSGLSVAPNARGRPGQP